MRASGDGWSGRRDGLPSVPLRRPALIASRVMAVGAVGAAARRAAPLAPLRLAPARVSDFTARRIASTSIFASSSPTRTTNGSMPADLDYLEVFAFTDDPAEALKAPLANRVLPLFATNVARIDVRPPPPPEPKTDEEKKKREAALAARRRRRRPIRARRKARPSSSPKTLDAAIETPVDRAEVFKEQPPGPPAPVVERDGAATAGVAADPAAAHPVLHGGRRRS